MATVEVVSANTALPEDTMEASLKADQEKTKEEVVETPTLASEPSSEQTKEEEAPVTKVHEPEAPEGKPSVEVETKEVVVEAVNGTVEKTEDETKKEEDETEVVEETKENVDAVEVQAPAAAESETVIQKEDVVKEEKVAEPEPKDKVDTEAPTKQSEEKVDIEASDEKNDEEVITEVPAEKSEEVTDAPTEKTE